MYVNKNNIKNYTAFLKRHTQEKNTHTGEKIFFNMGIALLWKMLVFAFYFITSTPATSAKTMGMYNQKEYSLEES